MKNPKTKNARDGLWTALFRRRRTSQPPGARDGIWTAILPPQTGHLLAPQTGLPASPANGYQKIRRALGPKRVRSRKRFLFLFSKRAHARPPRGGGLSLPPSDPRGHSIGVISTLFFGPILGRLVVSKKHCWLFWLLMFFMRFWRPQGPFREPF